MGDLLTTKLFAPPTRPELVARTHLVEQLNAGTHRKLTLVSAPAGFGKTTLLADWLSGSERPVAWLSLDEGDSDPKRFLTYLVAALQKTVPDLGSGVIPLLQSPQQPPVEAILTSLLNDIASLPQPITLTLDDYHLVDSQPVDQALAFTLEHCPPQLHLVIATREDPQLPLPRLRARDQLSELRAADLRFSTDEAAEFLNRVMGLDLSSEQVAALESRTEGWIAGLQLAALSLRSSEEPAGFIASFTGSHRLVLDYLIAEVLERQPEDMQRFLLQTSILNRLTGSLCDALTARDDGQATLEALERANLFIVPLDNERLWYRYHHLFADLLRRRLQQTQPQELTNHHRQASVWYEQNGDEIEAFQHAIAGNDIERAERLLEGRGVPLYFRGALTPVLKWLQSLPVQALDSRPSLWVAYASAVLFTGRFQEVEDKLQAAEAAIGISSDTQDRKRYSELDEKTRDLVGRIASIRANMAVGHRQLETIISESRRALEYLHPDNRTYRTDATWQLGVAYEFQGERALAAQAYREAIANSEASGNIYTQILATTGLANILLAENQLGEATETYQRVLELVGHLPIPVGCHVHLCLARISYELNDMDAAEQHGRKSLQLAQPYKDDYDIIVSCLIFLARLKLARGNPAGAASHLAEAQESLQEHDFTRLIPELVAAQTKTLLHQGDIDAAVELVEKHEIPSVQARVALAQGQSEAALADLEPLVEQARMKGYPDERLKALVLLAVARYVQGQVDQALELLGEALALAESGGFIRTFVDEGELMARLLYEALKRGTSPEYVRRLLAAFPEAEPKPGETAQKPLPAWIGPLSERELEVLELIAEGLTNPEIAARLYLSLNTVKAHTRNLYSKLDVNNRTSAVARARDLGILGSM